MTVVELFDESESNHPYLERLLAHSYLLALAAMTVGPYVVMLSISFMGDGWRPVVPPKLVPHEPSFVNYIDVLQGNTALLPHPFYRFVINTLVLAVGATLVVVVVDSLAGYAFARLQFAGRDITFGIVLATMMISPMILFIPVYTLFREIGLIDSYLGLILPHTVSAFGVFLMRQFIKTLPSSLEDAALIDGCSWFGIYWQIVLPMMVPALVTLGVITFITSWNSFLWPLVIARDPDYFTMTVALGYFQGQEETQWAMLMAATSITMIPVVIVFVALQKYYVRGFEIGGMKGD